MSLASLVVYSMPLQDYEDGKSPEAVVVKDLDKFDMIFQAFEYEKGITNDCIFHTVNHLQCMIWYKIEIIIFIVYRSKWDKHRYLSTLYSSPQVNCISTTSFDEPISIISSTSHILCYWWKNNAFLIASTKLYQTISLVYCVFSIGKNLIVSDLIPELPLFFFFLFFGLHNTEEKSGPIFDRALPLLYIILNTNQM